MQTGQNEPLWELSQSLPAKREQWRKGAAAELRICMPLFVGEFYIPLRLHREHSRLLALLALRAILSAFAALCECRLILAFSCPQFPTGRSRLPPSLWISNWTTT
jgi:hypothetical protein